MSDGFFLALSGGVGGAKLALGLSLANSCPIPSLLPPTSATVASGPHGLLLLGSVEKCADNCNISTDTPAHSGNDYRVLVCVPFPISEMSPLHILGIPEVEFLFSA